MQVAFGIVVVVLASLAWLGQATSWLAPAAAAQWGLMEPEDSVEPVYFADVRGEARWDTLVLWIMVVAGLLMIVDGGAWPYFGLVGGGMFIYFAGRGVVTRREMQRRGYRIGATRNVTTAYALSTVWGLMGGITVAVAIAELSS